MDDDTRGAIASRLIKDSMHRNNDGFKCALCGDAVRPLAFNVVTKSYSDSSTPPSGFVLKSSSSGSILGAFPICDACAPPCVACGLPIPTESVMEFAHVTNANMGNGICTKHIYWKGIPKLIFKRMFGLGRFKKKDQAVKNNNFSTSQDVQTLASSFIRNTASKFDSFCSKNKYNKTFDYKGPFFAWSILWLSLSKARNPDETLKSITIDSLNLVIKVDQKYTMKAIDLYVEKETGTQGANFAMEMKSMGFDINKTFEHAHLVFVDRLSDAIQLSLQRIKSEENNKFIPILNLIMGRNAGNGRHSQFDEMTDNEFEYIFLEQCVESFTKGQVMAIRMIDEYHLQNLRPK